ncbi:MAG: acyl-CoA reductase [Pseudomonadota bacterium]
MSSAVNIRYAADQQPTFAATLERLQSAGARPRLGVGERLDAMHALAAEILNPASELRKRVPSQGLAYLATFLQRSYLEGLLKREIGDLDSLQAFADVGSRKSIRRVPRGVVCHWLAGNVPLLAMFSWAVSVLLGNKNVMRLSSRQQDVVSPFLEALQSISAIGEQIANETVVASFPSSDAESHAAMSSVADARIAWGGEEAVTAVRSLAAPWECEDIVFGPRVSLAVVDPEFIDNKGIARLATDAVIFDQLACSSPQCVFVKAPRDSDELSTFRETFEAAFEKATMTYPRHSLDFSESYIIELDRARAVLEGGTVFHDSSTRWTVAVMPAPNDTIQCANHFVQLIPFDSLDTVYEFIPLNIQTAVTQLGPDDYDEFTEEAAHRGVCRFPRPGEGNNFENPWDGVGLVSRLTRAVIRTNEHR